MTLGAEGRIDIPTAHCVLIKQKTVKALKDETGKTASSAAKSKKTKAKKKKPATRKKKETVSFREMTSRVRAVLLELMCSSESDSVRVAAAKALMDKLEKGSEAKRSDESDALNKRERAELLDEARELLAAFAEEKSGGSSGAASLDQDG